MTRREKYQQQQTSKQHTTVSKERSEFGPIKKKEALNEGKRETKRERNR